MPASVPSPEALENAVLDFAWRCGRRAKEWCKSHGIFPWLRLEKLLFAFTQGWFGEKLQVPEVLVEQLDLLDLVESGSLAEVLERTCKRAQKFSEVGGIRS